MTLLGVNRDYRLPTPVYSNLPPIRDFTKIPDFTKIHPQYPPSIFPKYNVTPPENPQDERVLVAMYACFFGAIATLFTAMILTRTSFESKTKTAISLAGGATVIILSYMNPLIGFVALAILCTLACTISKEPSSTDGLLKWLTPDEKRGFPYDVQRNFFLMDAALQRDRDALRQRQAEQAIRNMRPMFYPLVIHPRERMPLPRFVLPHFFFNDFPAIQDLQSHTIAGG